jgi:hypothetical protein
MTQFGDIVGKILMKKPLRIYHTEDFNMSPHVDIRYDYARIEKEGISSRRGARKVVGYSGLTRYKPYAENYDFEVGYGPILKHDVLKLLGKVLEGPVGLRPLFRSDSEEGGPNIYPPIIVMPKCEIEKEYVFGKNTNGLFEYLWNPMIIDEAYSVETMHSDKCPCESCTKSRELITE